jgi:hypothetical protein
VLQPVGPGHGREGLPRPGRPGPMEVVGGRPRAGGPAPSGHRGGRPRPRAVRPDKRLAGQDSRPAEPPWRCPADSMVLSWCWTRLRRLGAPPGRRGCRVRPPGWRLPPGGRRRGSSPPAPGGRACPPWSRGALLPRGPPPRQSRLLEWFPGGPGGEGPVGESAAVSVWNRRRSEAPRPQGALRLGSV